jgi:hypothetical protein
MIDKMGRILILLITFAAVAHFAEAQDDPPTLNREKTLIGEELESGGYGGLEIKTGSVRGENAMMVGARGGWIINHTISIGGGGFGIVTNHIIEDYEVSDPNDYDTTVYLNGGYGGLFIEYINSSNSLIHFTINTLIGAGGVNYSGKMKFEPEKGSDWKSHETSPFFVIEPGATVDINIASFFRMGFCASWRFVDGVDLPGTGDDDISSFSGSVIFKFGKF